jgi:hypothetical protein
VNRFSLATRLFSMAVSSANKDASRLSTCDVQITLVIRTQPMRKLGEHGMCPRIPIDSSRLHHKTTPSGMVNIHKSQVKNRIFKNHRHWCKSLPIPRATPQPPRTSQASTAGLGPSHANKNVDSTAKIARFSLYLLKLDLQPQHQNKRYTTSE